MKPVRRTITVTVIRSDGSESATTVLARVFKNLLAIHSTVATNKVLPITITHLLTRLCITRCWSEAIATELVAELLDGYDWHFTDPADAPIGSGKWIKKWLLSRAPDNVLEYVKTLKERRRSKDTHDSQYPKPEPERTRTTGTPGRLPVTRQSPIDWSDL